jgi:hypothetical protein
VLSDKALEADAIEQLKPHAVAIILDAGDELVSDVKLGQRVRALLNPPAEIETRPPAAGANVVHLTAWLEGNRSR